MFVILLSTRNACKECLSGSLQEVLVCPGLSSEIV